MSESIEEAVIGIVQEAVGGEITSRSSTVTNQGWDSLAAIEVLENLDARWPGVTARNPALGSAGSVREITDIISKDIP